MSCISSNFSSFFLNSLNDPSEFSKYLSNGELKCTNFEDFQVFGCGAGVQQQQQQQQLSPYVQAQQQQQQHQHLHHHHHHHHQQQLQQQQLQSQVVNGNAACGVPVSAAAIDAGGGGVYDASSSSSNTTINNNNNSNHYAPHAGSQQQQHAASHFAGHTQSQQTPANGNYAHQPQSQQQQQQQQTNYAPTPHSNRWPTAIATPNGASPTSTLSQHFDGSFEFIKYLRHSSDFNANGSSGAGVATTNAASESVRAHTPNTNAGNNGSSGNNAGVNSLHHHHHPHPHPHQSTNNSAAIIVHSPASPNNASIASVAPSTAPGASSLIDLDSTSQKSRSASRKVAALLSSVSRASNSLDSSTLDVFDHDSKQTIFDLQHMTNGSNSNESSMELSSLAFANSHLNASNSNTSSEGAAAGNAEFGVLNACSSSAPKPLTTFTIKENFEVHAAHKVEEGIFQHMNKLPPKKKETLKQLGVRFTGQMTLTDKSIVVDNFVRFCEEYDIKDHRPFLSLNQSGLNKPEQIKFARFLGQGLPTFTLFCIYSNFKNLFCTKRTEIYTKDGYNLPYILDKTKRFLANTTAGNNNNNNTTPITTTTTTPAKPNSLQTQQQQQQTITTTTNATETHALMQTIPTTTTTTQTPSHATTPTPSTAPSTGANQQTAPHTPQQQQLHHHHQHQQQQQQQQHHMTPTINATQNTPQPSPSLAHPQHPNQSPQLPRSNVPMAVTLATASPTHHRGVIITQQPLPPPPPPHHLQQPHLLAHSPHSPHASLPTHAHPHHGMSPMTYLAAHHVHHAHPHGPAPPPPPLSTLHAHHPHHHHPHQHQQQTTPLAAAIAMTHAHTGYAVHPALQSHPAQPAHHHHVAANAAAAAAVAATTSSPLAPSPAMPTHAPSPASMPMGPIM